MTTPPERGIEETIKEFDLRWYHELKEQGLEPMRNDMVGFIHQELQKARQTWLREEIVKLEGMKAERFKWDYKEGDGQYKDGFNEALQTIIDRYQYEMF